MNNIKLLRKNKKLSQQTLSQMLGITQSNLSSWENNKWEPDNASIIKMCEIFGCTADYLLGITDSINIIKIPVVGEIRAGYPTLAEENIIDYEEIPEKIAKMGEFFGLKIKGDSMAPRILENDVVIIRKQESANNGDTCAVLVNGDEATLKKVKFVDNGIMLIPNNPNYETLFYSTKEIQQLPVKIVGKVVELRGKY